MFIYLLLTGNSFSNASFSFSGQAIFKGSREATMHGSPVILQIVTPHPIKTSDTVDKMICANISLRKRLEEIELELIEGAVSLTVWTKFTFFRWGIASFY